MTVGCRLSGKVAIVTGAAGGLGAATSVRLANEGAKVIAAGRDRASLEATMSVILALGGQCAAHVVDLADPESIEALFAFADTAGGVDIVYNNAARTNVADDGRVENMDISVWESAFQVNLRGTMLMCRAAIPRLRARGGGSIINVASGVGVLADVARTAYGVSKSAVITLTRFVATQEGKSNIRCNVICPGLMLTPAVEAQLSPEALAMMLRHGLMPRLGTPEDIAAAVVYLASDEASYVTGQLIGVDGGALVHLPYYAELMAAAAREPP